MLERIFESLTSLALGRIAPALIIVALGILATRIVMKLVNNALAHSKLEKAAHSLISSLVRVVLYLLIALMAASSLGIDVTSIVTLASVLTLAISLSVQNALTNVIGGFTLLYTKPFVSGDYVEIAAQAGTVQEIGLSYTRLTTPDNKLISIPNSSVVSAQIVNYTTTGTRRVEVRVSASYGSEPRQVMDALVQAGTVPNVLLEPAPQAVIAAYGESAIEYSLRLWVKTADYWSVYYEVMERTKKTFDEQGIKMTYPHLNVHLDR